MQFLIVEDDPGMREDLCDCIKEIGRKPDLLWGNDGFDTVDVECAADAKARLRDPARSKQPYDLMLLDLQLPERRGGVPKVEKGFSVLRVAQEEGAARAIVIVSGITEEINHARRLGAIDFVSKEKLRRLDVQNAIIRALNSLPPKEPVFHSCVISYSTKDQEFATQLFGDLRERLVPCWIATEDLRIGERFRQRIAEAIRSHDKLLLVLSQDSLASRWVEHEVEIAFEIERQQNSIVLFPIHLDDAIMKTDKAWAGEIRQTRHIGDFSDWRNHNSYKKALNRLLRDLKARNNG
jgi:CheY-like chemotaxis protein